jgi:ATP-dependent RNA helicase UAP56/SUB2
MFSATMNDLVHKHCKWFMFKPLEVYVDVDSKLTLHSLKEYYINLLEAEKSRKLSELLDQLEFNQVCIFVKSVTHAQQLDWLLRDINFPSVAIHAQMAHETCMALFKDFRDFKMHIVVTTNVLSHGVDVTKVNVMINYDFPFDADTYLHWVGHTGRFRTKGLAISFVASGNNKAMLKNVQDRFEVQIPEMPNELNVADYMNVN